MLEVFFTQGGEYTGEPFWEGDKGVFHLWLTYPSLTFGKKVVAYEFHGVPPSLMIICVIGWRMFSGAVRRAFFRITAAP